MGLYLPLTPAQMKENLERHQEKLEEKQAACLEQIQEMEKQVGAPGCKGTGLWGATSQEVGGEELAPLPRGQGSGSQGVMRHFYRSLHLVGRPSPGKPPDGFHFPP